MNDTAASGGMTSAKWLDDYSARSQKRETVSKLTLLHLLEKSLDPVVQMIVNRMRVRVRLNEGRVAEMLRGMDPVSLGDSFVSVTAGLLHCIGDVAALTFVPVFAGAVLA